MPYIETKTTVKLDDELMRALKEAYADAITLIPGKSEQWLMLGFEDGKRMAFRGDMQTDCAMLEVDIFGSASDSAYDALTERLCQVVSRVLGISPDRIYVKYRECDRWGYNGFNF